jgi:hypothetical protein
LRHAGNIIAADEEKLSGRRSAEYFVAKRVEHLVLETLDDFPFFGRELLENPYRGIERRSEQRQEPLLVDRGDLDEHLAPVPPAEPLSAGNILSIPLFAARGVKL